MARMRIALIAHDELKDEMVDQLTSRPTAPSRLTLLEVNSKQF